MANTQGLIIGIIIMIVLAMIGLHIYSAINKKSVITGSPIVFYMIIGLFSVAAFFLFKSTATGSGLNLNQIAIPLLIAGALIFIIMKFPQLVPAEFAIAGRRAVGLIPIILPISLARVRATRRGHAW